MPKISCVIPTKNRAGLIGETIASIVAQREADWELIIVDDHSDPDDRTEQIANEFGDSRIKYHKLDQNGYGVSAARNKGNILACSKYIAVMDSDDISSPEHFSTLLTELETNDCDVVYGEYDYWDPDSGKIWQRSEQYKSRPFDLEYLKRFNFIPHVATAYKKQIAMDFPYNSFFRRGEDWDLFLRLGRFGYKFLYVPKTILKVRRHQGSIITQTLSEYDYDAIVRENNGK